jgi:hypothetical protein
MDPLVEVVMISQFEAIEREMSLVYKLKAGQINEYITSLPTAIQPAIHRAIEFCSTFGWIPELIYALKYLYDGRGRTLIQHLQVSHPSSIPALLNHTVYVRQLDIAKIKENMNNGSINIECLRAFLRHPKTRRIMYLLTPPLAKYLQVFKEEKEVDKISYMRRIFWSSQVARMRLQANYVQMNLQLNKLLYQTLLTSF